MTNEDELREKIASLKRQIAIKDESLRKKNIALTALRYVWCSGGCKGGIDNWEGINEEVVQAAEHNTKRLREWWQSKQSRDKWRSERERLNENT